MSRVVLITRKLDRGGAERQLVVLAKGLARRGHAVAVAVFFAGGAYEAELAGTGVRVIHLGKKGRWDVLPFLARLVRLMRKERPAVLHAYLTVPNILAAALKPLLPGTRIVWGVRASNMDLSRYDWLSRLAYAVERRLACCADGIIANSTAGKVYAAGNGFPEEKIRVIPNGIDTDHFRPDAGGRVRVRSAWGVGEGEVLVGLVARLDPMKGHPIFLEAASRVARARPAARFVCVGGGPQDYAAELRGHAQRLGLSERLVWAGALDDMRAVYGALDVACSASSYGEGFSNSIAEALACGVPCVVTDVGDSALIVGAADLVVAPGDAAALATALLRLIDVPADARRALGARGRARVVSEFGIDRLLRATEIALSIPEAPNVATHAR